MTLLLWWLLLFGVWPLADPGHSDLSSALVWLDLGLHGTAAVLLLNREIERRVEERCRVDADEAARERAYWWNQGAKYERRHMDTERDS